MCQERRRHKLACENPGARDSGPAEPLDGAAGALPTHFRLPHSALKRRQNLPLDVTVPGSQHRVMTNETKTQLAFSWATSTNYRGSRTRNPLHSFSLAYNWGRAGEEPADKSLDLGPLFDNHPTTA